MKRPREATHKAAREIGLPDEDRDEEEGEDNENNEENKTEDWKSKRSGTAGLARKREINEERVEREWTKGRKWGMRSSERSHTSPF